MNYIQYMQTPFQPIGFTVGVSTDKTPTKEELIQQREEQARSQAKKENNIVTETDRQHSEIEANKQKAKEEIADQQAYREAEAAIRQEGRPIINDQLNAGQEFIGYVLPGYGTVMLADDAQKSFRIAGQALKHGQVAPAVGQALRGTSEVVMGAASLIPVFDQAIDLFKGVKPGYLYNQPVLTKRSAPIVQKEVSNSKFAKGVQEKEIPEYYAAWKQNLAGKDAKVSLYSKPTKQDIGYADYVWLLGEVDQPLANTTTSQILAQRAKGFQGYTDDIAKVFSDAQAQKPVLMMPVDGSMANIGGYSVRSFGGQRVNYINANPYRPKSYKYTGMHEGVMHPTEEVVRNLTATVNGSPMSVRDVYRSISYPSDIIPQKILNQLASHGGSSYWNEARAMNGEFLSAIVDKALKSGKYTPEELINNPSILSGVIKNNFSGVQNRSKLISFLNSFDSGYVADWIKYLTSSAIPEAVKQRYAERIVTMMSRLPNYGAPIAIGGSATAAMVAQDQSLYGNEVGTTNYLNYSK